MEGQLVYRPRIEAAYPDADFHRPGEEGDEEEEFVDDTVTHPENTAIPLWTNAGNRATKRSKTLFSFALISASPCLKTLHLPTTKKPTETRQPLPLLNVPTN